MGFFKCVIFAFILVGSSNGASGASARNCTDVFNALSCSFRIQDFVSKIYELDMDEKSDMGEFKRACDALDNCFKIMEHCQIRNDDDAKKSFTMAPIYCGTHRYLDNEFATCREKLGKAMSKCYFYWNPFLYPEDLNDKERAEETCVNIFGKNECMKKEISKHCSHKEWEGFRDHFFPYIAAMQCDFIYVI